MKEAKELREPTEMYHAQPLEVYPFLLILIQVAPTNLKNLLTFAFDTMIGRYGEVR